VSVRAHDLTLAVRNIVQRPLFAATAILLMALAAGANAAVFSVVRGVLLKPLPYAQPDRLVTFWPDAFVSNEDIAYWRARTPGVAEIAGVSPGWLMALVAEGYEPTKVTGGRVSGNFFRMLGVGPAIGRTIEPGDSAPGRTGVVVISADLFARQFASNPAVIGRTVYLDGARHEIVGVMPRGFEFMGPGTDIWAPLVFDPADRNHKATFNQAFARLAPGATQDFVNRELTALTPAMRRELAKAADWGRTIRVESLQQTLTGTLQPTLLIMLGAVGLILMLAAVNVGTLVLSRAIDRAREIAVRTALGASRWRLVRQLVVEQAVLAAAGAIAGLAIARLALPVLILGIPPEMPRQSDITLDGVVFATVFFATLTMALLFASIPIVLVARPEVQPLLRQNQSTDTAGRQRALGVLVAAQIGLAVVLGIGAGLMLRSLWNLQHVNPGFDSNGVLTFRLQTTSKYRALTTGMPYLEQVVERLRALPGVTSVGSIQHLPLSGYNWTSQAYPSDKPPVPGTTPPSAIWRFIGWDYFDTMRIPVIAGRGFNGHDTLESAPVAIVNEALARRDFGSVAAAVGQRIRAVNGGGAQDTEIVGVVGDVRFMSLDAPSRPEMYRPLTQTFMFPMAVVVRATGDPAALAAAVRQAAYAIDPAVPVAEMQTLNTLLAQSLGQPRLLTMLLSVFAGVGLLLTVVGVYGVVAYWVRRREREFGIRVALGAAPTRIARGVLRQGALLAAVGIAIAIPAALLLARLMRTVVYDVTTHDPLTFVTLPVTVMAVTLAAAYLPARRAARVDPALTMKSE
jgi:putative ABC transport system permease protein